MSQIIVFTRYLSCNVKFPVETCGCVKVPTEQNIIMITHDARYKCFLLKALEILSNVMIFNGIPPCVLYKI